LELGRHLTSAYQPLDPTIYFGVTALLLLVTTAACLAPARRAALFDPVVVLRGE
jgi:ABC-type lipoprotein release transport system permease subunit